MTSTDTPAAVRAAFGPYALRHALFYQRPGGLRLDLCDTGALLDRVLDGLTKALAICQDVFAGRPVRVCLVRTLAGNAFSFRHALRELRCAGVVPSALLCGWIDTTYPADDAQHDPDRQVLNIVFDLPAARLRNLLWCALVAEMCADVRPNPGCEVYLLDLATGVLVHPYDHRGMDVVGGSFDVMRALYLRHERHLLDYDRAVMDRVFRSDDAGGFTV